MKANTYEQSTAACEHYWEHMWASNNAYSLPKTRSVLLNTKVLSSYKLKLFLKSDDHLNVFKHIWSCFGIVKLVIDGC